MSISPTNIQVNIIGSNRSVEKNQPEGRQRLCWLHALFLSARKGCSSTLRMPMRVSGSLLSTTCSRSRQAGDRLFGKTMIELT